MSIPPPADFIMRRVAFAGVGTALLALAGWITLRNLSLPSDDGWIFWGREPLGWPRWGSCAGGPH